MTGVSRFLTAYRKYNEEDSRVSELQKDAKKDRAEEEPVSEGPARHWTFFETIDEDLNQYSRYLEFHESNFSAFSINLARLYLSICSEVDVVAKLLCHRIGSTVPATP